MIANEFNYEAFRATYRNEVIPIFVASDRSQPTVVTSDTKVAPNAGQSIIALINPVGKTALEDGRYRIETPLSKS